MDNFYLSSQISVRHPSGLSEISLEDDSEITIFRHEDRKWRLSYLKEQFESLELHKLFEIYTKKIHHGYFSLFLILLPLLSLAHFLVVACSTMDHWDAVLPDLILYFMIFCLSTLGLITVDKLVKRYQTIQCFSIIAFVLLTFVNGFIPIYNYSANVHIRPSYTELLILSCYVFFGIEKLVTAVTMGLFVTTTNILILIFVTYRHSGWLWQSVISDTIFDLYLNALGIYFRYMNEIIIRRSFLDRRECINSTYQLRHEKEQTETLMESIIPRYVIDKVKQNYIEATAYYRKHKKHLIRNPFDNSLLDEHENVSILFADIVHYTEMTMKLDITDLIETLNDLFSLFDESSRKLNVSRIKFLGDCYYCVAGLPPTPAENHAEACVDLGLEMISIIANIRKKRNVNINMRIGIHSGRIISGIIGSVKYQFDIWSKDVDIANKIESEGEAGKVHITNKTKECLKKTYNISSNNKSETAQYFKQYDLQTFLISPTEPVEDNENPEPKKSLFKKQKSFPNGILLHSLQRSFSIVDIKDNYQEDIEMAVGSNGLPRDSSISSYRRKYYNNRASKTEERRSIADAKRRTAFMNNNLKRYAERTQIVNEDMEKTINKISFSKYEQYTSKTKEVSFFLVFNNWKDEIEYITVPDPLFKYYLLSSLGLILGIYLIQNLTMEKWESQLTIVWPYLATIVFICSVVVPLAFSQFFWNKYLAKYAEKPPRNTLTICIKKLSDFITKQFIVRFIIFTTLYALFLSCFVMEARDCANNIKNHTQTISENEDLSQIYPKCVIPWQMTQTCMFIILMTFLFMKMFLWIKVVYAVVTIVLQCYGVLKFSSNFYEASETFNYNVKPPVTHILAIVSLVFMLHTLDRQTDYMNRLNHLQNNKVRSEQEEANSLQFVNENLLLNILPRHVASLYLDVSRNSEELYYEEHNDTAVIFASIITEDLQDILDEKSFLTLMNDYITSFDTLINRAEFKSIEKIKIAKWTYMAACGLFPNARENEYDKHITCTSLDILLNFASEMYKKLDHVNRTRYQDCKLRIGICHGSIVAGVVGSKKPLYDIWGDPVNMASRMDSTGVPNRIQVMEETAEIIRGLGYVVVPRGKVYVKGREGRVQTYFVKLDRDYNLVKKKLS